MYKTSICSVSLVQRKNSCKIDGQEILESDYF